MPKTLEAETDNDNLLIEDTEQLTRFLRRRSKLGNAVLTAPEEDASTARDELIRLIKAAGKLGGLALALGFATGAAFETVRDH